MSLFDTIVQKPNTVYHVYRYGRGGNYSARRMLPSRRFPAFVIVSR